MKDTLTNEIVFKATGKYRCSGVAYVILWGGQPATVTMTSFIVKDVTKSSIASGINDGGYGCQSIDKAKVVVHKMYSNIQNSVLTEVYLGRITLTAKVLEGAKRGI